MKRVIVSVLLIILCAALSGCGRQTEDVHSKETLNIYASFYPLYAITSAVTENVEGIELHCLAAPQDGCLRSYTLSDWDSALISSADAVIIGGRGLESFEETLYSYGDNGPAVCSLLYNHELLEMSESNSDSEESHWTGVNPHLYMSIKGGMQLVESVAAHLSVLDPMNAETYRSNAETADNRLESIAENASEKMETYKGTNVILMNEAFAYTADDLGLTTVLCIERESGENYYEQELSDCIEQMCATGAKVVIIERQAPASLKNAIKDAGFAVAEMDTMTTFQNGYSFDEYINTLESNIEIISGAIERSIQ